MKSSEAMILAVMNAIFCNYVKKPEKFSKIRTNNFSVFKKPCQRDPGGQTLTLTCKDIDRAWDILDIEFANKRKLMDELLAKINSHGLVKGDKKSLTRYATTTSVLVNGMLDSGCPVQDASFHR